MKMKEHHKEDSNKKVLIIGGGPAGLTASYQLSKADVESIVLEKDQTLGGLSRTVDYKNYYKGEINVKDYFNFNYNDCLSIWMR